MCTSMEAHVVIYFLYFFSTVSHFSGATSSEASVGKHLVVIYDRWVDLSSAGKRNEDIHAKAAFQTAAEEFDLPVVYLKIPLEDLFLHKIWRSDSVMGVVSIGDCQHNSATLSLSKRGKTPALVMNNELCPSLKDNPMVLPLHRARIHRRYQCVAYILHPWIATASRQTNQTLSSAANSKLPIISVAYTTEDYRQEYMNCLGSDLLLDINEIDSSAPPPYLRMELAKRFLSGRKLTIATIHRPPFVSLEMSGTEITGATGFCLEMLNTMAGRFNFTYKLVPPIDGNWGAPVPNSPYFDGMVGMVQRHDVDLAIAGFTITYIRETVIDFTHAFYEEPTTILIPPPHEEDNFLAFLSPFSWQVWLVTLASVLIVGFFMWLLSLADSLPLMYPHTIRRVTYDLSRYVWDCAFALISQGNEMKQTEPIRVLNGLWWTFSIILIYTYTGNLIAFLTVPKVNSLINSLEELSNQREVLWTYRAKTAHDNLFSTAPSPSTYHKIGELLREKPDLLVKTDQEGVDAVLRGKTAFIKEKSWLDFAMERDYLMTKECRLFQVNQLFFSAGFGWALQEDSLYLPLFNAEILRMSQSGLFTVWRRNYWPKPNKCTASKASAASAVPRPLHLGNFLGHFFLLGVGVVLASIAFGIEWIYRVITLANKRMELVNDTKTANLFPPICSVQFRTDDSGTDSDPTLTGGGSFLVDRFL